MSLIVIFQDMDGTSPPLNPEGVGYPTYYDGSPSEGGVFNTSMDSVNRAHGARSLKMSMVSGPGLYAQWNPYDGVSRYFARQQGFCQQYNLWQFNTINRFSFWLYNPSNGEPEYGNIGQNNFYMGTYVKRVTNPNNSSDEDGGGHFYHNFEVARGAWSKCVMDWHPSHERGADPNVEHGEKQYPTTGDPPSTYNYWDAYTRWYISHAQGGVGGTPVYNIDDLRFWQETNPEDLDNVYSLCASYTQSTNRIYLTWNRKKGVAYENDPYDVRYSFSDIHTIGWNNATPAPGGTGIIPPGGGSYATVPYDTTQIDVSGQNTIYLAVRKQGQPNFRQIELPLSLPYSDGGGGGGGGGGGNEPLDAMSSWFTADRFSPPRVISRW